MNLNSREFEEARIGSFSELPDGTIGRGKDRSYHGISNPDLSWWHLNHDWVLKEYEELFPIFIKVRNLEGRKVEFSYHAVVGEICIYVDGHYYGYFDNYEIEHLLVEAKEQGLNF